MSQAKRRRIFTLKNKRRLPRWIPFVLAVLVRLLRRTYRLRIDDPGGFLSDPDRPWPVVFALWHNRILLLPDCCPRQIRQRSAVLISASRDGEYASAFIRHFGVQVVRGSSSRGGHRALLQMKSVLADGLSVVLTVDGPRGPRYEVRPGAVALSRMSGVPIVPISLNAPSRWELRGWDRTQIPKPFSKVELRVGLPQMPDGKSAVVDREGACAALRLALLDLTDDRISH